MILPAQIIRQRFRVPNSTTSGCLLPFVERTVHEKTGMSYGLSSAGYDVRLDQGITISPGQFVLASTLEWIAVPHDILAMVKDKSTLARRGLAVQNTVLEPGWRGYTTLEITNHGPHSITLPAGSPIAQFVFHLLVEPTEQPYRGKYQDQQRGAVEARREAV